MKPPGAGLLNTGLDPQTGQAQMAAFFQAGKAKSEEKKPEGLVSSFSASLGLTVLSLKF
jgi:hypothetical protein